MEYSIIIDRLRKTYSHGTRFSPGEATVALDLQERLEIPRGELFGIIGPDGAGKTTLFRILATLILADSGTATIEGLDVVRDYKQLRKITGYMPGRFSLYPDLSVRENLQFYADVFGADIQKNYPLIEDIYCRLEPFEKRRAGKLSGGMKQKLALCCSLIHAPKLLYLDEPTTGVDPSSRREFWDSLGKLKAATGMTMVVSTAYMDEASRCDRVAMMKEGRFLTVGTPKAIIDGFDGILLAVRSDEMFRLLHDIRQLDAVANCYTFGDAHHVLMKRRESDPAGVADADEAMALLKKVLTEKFGHTNVGAEVCKATMEDCYMYLSSLS